MFSAVVTSPESVGACVCAAVAAVAVCVTSAVPVSVSKQYLHNIYTISTQYLQSIYTVSTKYLHIIYTGSTTSSFLLVQHSAVSDSGRYSCQPSLGNTAATTVHVIRSKSHQHSDLSQGSL